MNNTSKVWLGIVTVIAIVGLFTGVGRSAPAQLGAEGDTNLTNLVLDGDLTVGDDATISGGSLSLTTSNTATSTLVVGCIQTTATSTASPIKIVPVASTTAAGYFIWQFGTCPTN